MEPNSINIINQIAESQAVWAILFITLAYYFLRQSEKREIKIEDKAEEREKALMKELSDMNKSYSGSLSEISQSMKEISEGQKVLGGRVDRMEKVIYKGVSCNDKN